MTRRSSHGWRAIAVTSALVLLAASCGDDDDDASSGEGDRETVAIAFVGPITGENANLGLPPRDAVKTAIAEANERGGDYEFVLKEFDTQGDPAQAPGQKDKYINDDEIVAVVGPTFSGETKAVIPDLESAGLLMISPSATNKDLPTVVPDSKVFHRVIADDTFQGKGIGAYLSTELKAKALAVVHDNTEYGKGLADDVTSVFRGGGGNIATTQVINPAGQDFSAAVNSVRSANPDVVFYAGYYPQSGPLRKQLVDAGVRATFISGDGSLAQNFITGAGSAAEGALVSCPCQWASKASEGSLRDFYDSFRDEIGKDPETYAPEAYDTANMIIDAINDGHDTREELVTYFEEEFESYEGVSKPIEFETNGNIKETGVYVFEVKNGVFTLKKAPS
jgi:branched-chain amino acid transport system substrate-binding protein